MDSKQRAAFLAALVDELSREGWVGKTHVQKATYFAQEAALVDLDYRFVIHHYGPYSFDLESELETLESQGVLSVTPETDGYGYNVALGGNANDVEIPPDVRQHAESVAGYLMGLGASELELLSTALYVRHRLPGADDERYLSETKRLKPKFSEAHIAKALEEAASIETGLRSSR